MVSAGGFRGWVFLWVGGGGGGGCPELADTWVDPKGAGRGPRFKELSGRRFGWLGRFGLALAGYSGHCETAIAY